MFCLSVCLSFPPSLANGNEKMYHSTKSDIIHCIEKEAEAVSHGATETGTQQQHDCVVQDGGQLIHQLDSRGTGTFEQFTQRLFLKHLQVELRKVSRLDIVWDTYRPMSIKGHTRDERGHGVRLKVGPNVRIPGNLSEFLRDSTNITKQNNEKIHNAINEVSKGDCIIMGDFNHGNIKWDTLQSTGVEDSTFLCLVQDNFLTQHVLEPTRAARVLDIVLSSQKEFVDNVVIQEPLGSSDHNQLHFNIKIKSDKTKVKQCRRDFRKGNYKEIRKRLAHIDWNDKMKNKTATECWNILRGEIDSAIDSFVIR